LSSGCEDSKVQAAPSPNIAALTILAIE
jgi:hypothetical protein